MTKEEIQSKREEILAELLSTPYLKDIPYKLIESEEVPYTPLMRNFLYTFEFCRRRYIEESNFDELVGYDFDNDKFLFLLRHNFDIRVNHDADWTLESMKELMLYIEAETKPEYREMLKVEMENYDKQRQELLDLFVFCNKQKKLRFDSNPAFTDIDFDMLNQHLYNDYHIYLSVADRRTLNTVGRIINHIIYRLKDGNGSL
ncbi:hypothetical protein SAMN04487851_11022 [Prevotella sp. tc2-28]|uniref:hypothetical protein n=1 Tax=Prevotella sp. tc2-28 TaxID=1761888 RepID=UPI000895B0BE|nr:hypothetical protein [Prevotella sp. tc2-28]SEA64476.1 hypothetical protein SAMN04487851_11022 [Prevotella sp. tc2-28]